MKNTPQLDFIIHFTRFINASAGGRRLTPAGRKITPGTITNYRYALQLIMEYQQNYNTILRIQLLHRATLRIMRHEKNYWAKFFLQFPVLFSLHLPSYNKYINYRMLYLVCD
jgi:hypothetical protein